MVPILSGLDFKSILTEIGQTPPAPQEQTPPLNLMAIFLKRFNLVLDRSLDWIKEGSSLLLSATRCRIVECTQVNTLSTRHVPAGPYAGVLATRCVVGAKPRGQCTELGSNGDRRTPRGILPR